MRYLLPLARAFEADGCEVLVTARDHGSTFELLEAEAASFAAVGAEYGRGPARKLAGLAGRAAALVTRAARHRPAALVSASRAGVLAARLLRTRSFVVNDYEHVDLRAYRLGGAHVLFPSVIGAEPYLTAGFAPERLHPFRGIKEDLTFRGVDLEDVTPHPFPADEGVTRVLVRPPAETSHYFREASLRLTLEVLEVLAGDADALVVFSPRSRGQATYVEQVGPWARRPVVLETALPFAPLLAGVDALVSSGGTMLREAAYLGVPAVSLLRSETGNVDRYLASLGRLHFVESAEQFRALRFGRRPRHAALRSNPELADEIVDLVREQVGRT